MDKLAEMFAKIQPSDSDLAQMRAAAEDKMRRDMNPKSKNIAVMPPLPTPDDDLDLSNFNPSNPKFLEIMTRATTSPYPPPTTLPCGNVQVAKYTACKKPGKMACSACKLVSYCSKECQAAHWKVHKQDCRNPMRLEGWQPGWAKEGRPPSFITNDESFESIYFEAGAEREFSAGLSLWGNTPAMDVINFDHNEKDVDKDFSLAFAASGDLRHVLRSINGLPSNYSGNLNILINDINIPIVCRNIVLLLILGNIPDEAEAADIALHFWYSVFMPAGYRLKISQIISTFMYELNQNNGSPTRLGLRSKLYLCLPPASGAINFLAHFISPSISLGDIQDEYNRVRTAPSRRDFRDRMYAGLKPSHRVAFQEYRRFGIILPFGAINAHFNCPNASLFTLEGKWWQTDYADPLEGWDIGSVITTGKRFGATSEDIYGCLYFFLSEQILTFARRLRKTSTTFTVLCMDARHVPEGIRTGVFDDINLPRSIQFDRIAVSNILDANYVGIEGVLTLWAPLLADTESAAIVGYFMNWIMRQEDGRVNGLDPRVAADLAKKVMERSGITPKTINKVRPDIKSPMDFRVMMFIAMSDTDALYENSQPFSKFLQAEGMARILKKTNLKMRERHRIVPHRILGPLEGPVNALPEFPDDDAWYNYTKLSSFSWAERFVELERVSGDHK